MEGVTHTTPLLANTITGADNYVFEIVTAAGYFVEEVISGDNVITLAESGLKEGLLRDITIRVKTVVAGTTGDYGAPVTFSSSGLPLVPCTDISALEELVRPELDFDRIGEWRNEKIRQKLVEVEAYRGGGGCQTSYRIPVVFHVIFDPADPNTNVPDSYFLDQLEIINNEFNGPNPNTLGGNACLEFCLAQTTPSGEDWAATYGSTMPGVTRWADDIATHHGEGVVAQQQLADVVMFPRNQYLNVWICSDVLDGSLNQVGYATLPGGQGPIDGVVMEYVSVADYDSYFGYEEGFLLVHEIGHFLGLEHTFRGGAECVNTYPECESSGDYCCDTPPVSAANVSGCIDLTPQSCGVDEQLENYMDYAFEFCQNTFTEDQISRMHGALLAHRAELIDPFNHIVTGIAGPNGCTEAIVAAYFTSNGTQFCTNTQPCELSGIISYDTWEFVFTGGSLQSVSGTGYPEATIYFPSAGQWTIELRATSGTDEFALDLTVYVSDCAPIVTEQAQWRFGSHCGLDFTSGAPVAVSMEFSAPEGCATLAEDGTGAYSFSSTSYGVKHPITNNIMDPQFWGGNNYSSAQGALILHDQTDPDRYFIFSSRQTAPEVSPLHYSVLDLSLLPAPEILVLGQRDVPIYSNAPGTTEHLSALPHCNGVDHWIVTHGADDATFDKLISFRFSNAAIVETVLSPAYSLGPSGPNGNTDAQGLIKFNNEGTLAAITTAGGDCKLYSFDRANGSFEFVTVLPQTLFGYGASFSRSGDFLFTQASDGLYQYDLRNLDLCNPVIPSKFHALTQNVYPGSLQLGPDDKIYVSEFNESFISVINYPEVWSDVPNAIGFNYLGVQVNVEGNNLIERCQSGLPNMIDADPQALVDFQWCSVNCQNVLFEVRGCGNLIEWDVDCDGSINGLGNELTYAFLTPGSHCVSANIDGQLVTHIVDIAIPPVPSIIPEVVCLNVPVNYISTNTSGLVHDWYIDGAGTSNSPTNTETLEVWWNGPGEIGLFVIDPVTSCSNYTSLQVDPIEYLANAGPDIVTCQGEPVSLSALNGPLNCSWYAPDFLNDPETCSPILLASTPGSYMYTLNAVDGSGCYGTDDILVTVLSGPNFSPITPISTCAGQMTDFSVIPQAGMNYLWSADANGVINGPNDQSSCEMVWLASGTAYLSITDPVTGCVLTSDQQVSVADCFTCATGVGTIVPHGTLASDGIDGFSGTADIQGEYIVDVDVVVSYAHLYMEPGSEIIVKNGATLDIRDATLRSCNGVMWRGITVEDGGTLYISRSYVDDAENAVKALGGAVVSLTDNQFHNNRVAVYVPTISGVVQNIVSLSCKYNQFYSAGPMPAAYSDQTTVIGQTGYAAFDIQRVPLALTDGWNVFHHLSNGIVADRCDITLRDCSFHYIEPDATYELIGNGAAIHAQATKGWHTLDQVGSFVNGVLPFRECRWGAYTKRMNVYSSLNTMDQVGTAYHIEKSGSRDVHIHTNALDTKYDGIDLRFNDEAAQLLVEDNTITFGSAPIVGGPKGYTAIRVEEGNGQNPNSVIRNNTITYRSGVITAHTGIKLTAASDYLLAGNVMNMTDNATNYAGVQLLGCYDTEVSCNTVLGANNGYPGKGQAAIRNVKGGRPYISCNDMDRTTNGLLFSGESYGAEVRGNRIRKHKWGLHLDGTAIIDVQELEGNLWYDPAQAGGIEALYSVSDFQSSFSQFRIDPITLNGGVTWPPNWSPVEWIQPAFGPTYVCSNDQNANYCDQFGREKCEQCTNTLDMRIAADSLENDPYTEQTQWTLKADLYAKLDEAPALRDSLPNMEAFYNTMQNAVIGQLKAVEDERGTLALVDSTVAAELRANQQQMADILELMKTTLVQLVDSTLSSGQRQAIAASLAGYQQIMQSLATYNASAMQLARDTKVLSAESVRTTNAALGATELTESNAKEVNEVYLATIGKEVDGFTAEQTSTLFDIAYQCPMVGGNAVFRARALYNLIDAAQDYDDELLCLQHGIIVKSLKQPNSATLHVIPNPATDEATLVLDQVLDEAGTLLVFDALGAEVIRQPIPIEQLRVPFSTTLLSPALYHYKVFGNTGPIGHGKLTIVR